MRAYRLTAPFWIVLVANLGKMFVLTGSSWLLPTFSPDVDLSARAVPALISILVLGWSAALREADSNRLLAAEAGFDDPERCRAAYRHALRGPRPQDPGLAEAARRMAVMRLARVRTRSRRVLLVAAVVTVGVAILAIFRSPWWGGYVLLLGWGLIAWVRLPARLERRVRVLSQAAGLQV